MELERAPATRAELLLDRDVEEPQLFELAGAFQ